MQHVFNRFAGRNGVLLRPMLKQLFVIVSLGLACVTHASPKTKNVFLITVDGFRWQELYRGAQEDLISKEYQVTDTNKIRAQFWRETPQQRRQALLPFFWDVIARKGQLYGNGDKGSVAVVTNGKKFTYPGFNEIFTGSPDDRIKSNDKIPNPNVSVFEWLNHKKAFAGKIAAFVNWDTHPYILNTQRNGIPIWSGFEHSTIIGKPGSRLQLIQHLQRDTLPFWSDMSFDSFFFYAAREYVLDRHPRLVWLAFSETDEWAHTGNYARYLQAAHDVDNYIRQLWEAVQSAPAYRDKTTFIITCDHGRGEGADWRNHGPSITGAEKVWLAVLGPDTPPLGERTNIPQVTHSQIAATLAALLGEDYHGAVPPSGSPIMGVLPVRTKR